MMFSRKDLFKIIWPLFLQQVLSITVGMADSMMVASAGETAVSGVSLVGTLDVLLIYIFSSVATGGSVVLSQAIGRKDQKFAQGAAKQLIWAVTIIAFVVGGTSFLCRYPLLNALFGDAEAAVMDSALDYFFWMSLSFPFLGLFNGVAAVFRAEGNSMIGMKLSLLMNAVNIAGNALLIFGFHMGAGGAALATLFSRVVGAFVIVWLVQKKDHYVYVEHLWRYRPDLGVIKRILRIGIPSGLENSMFQFGKLLTQSLVSTLGTASIAANAVAGSLVSLQYAPGAAVNGAIFAVIGQCVGAGEEKQAKRYSRILLGVLYGSLGLIALVMSLLSGPLVRLYGLSGESFRLAQQMLLAHSLLAAMIWPLGFGLPNCFHAAGHVKFTLVISATSMWVFRVASAYLLALPSVTLLGLTIPGAGLGVMGVWVAMFIDWSFRGSVYIVRYLRGKWAHGRS